MCFINLALWALFVNDADCGHVKRACDLVFPTGLIRPLIVTSAVT